MNNNLSKYVVEIKKNDNIMNNIMTIVGECRIGSNDQLFFPYLIGLIIGQKIKFSTARKIRSKMYQETNSYNFTPQDILNLSDDQFNNVGVGTNVKKTIIETAKYFQLNNITNQSNITRNIALKLVDINGIGMWTISTLMIEYGIDMNLFPLGDKHVNKKLKEMYNVKEKDLALFVEKWSPYKSIAFWYLWKYELKY